MRRGLRTAKKGRPRDYTEVHGYDRTIYNGGHPYPGQDVVNVSGVFAGWSPSFSFYHGLKLSAILSVRISWTKEVISDTASTIDQSIQSPHSTSSQLLSYAYIHHRIIFCYYSRKAGSSRGPHLISWAPPGTLRRSGRQSWITDSRLCCSEKNEKQ